MAWTLGVTDLDALRNPSYAKDIMDAVMSSNEEARRSPEYLDTWAALHAAIGDFDGAIELQEKAMEQAHSQQREDVLDIRREALRAVSRRSGCHRGDALARPRQLAG